MSSEYLPIYVYLSRLGTCIGVTLDLGSTYHSCFIFTKSTTFSIVRFFECFPLHFWTPFGKSCMIWQRFKTASCLYWTLITNLLVCFPISDNGSSRESTIKALQVDANKLTTNFPWLVGKVVNLPSFSISQQPHYRNKHKLWQIVWFCS